MAGSRHPTSYGSGTAERLSTDLAARGLVIISGLARGIDTASHRGAIAAKGKTVAVLGTGIDVMYPKESTRLAEQIVALSGALISEFPGRNLPGSTKLSHPQPDHQRHVRRRTGGRSRGIQRHAHCFPLCPRTKPRPLRRSAQRNQQGFPGAREYPDQAGNEARCHVGRASGGCAGRTRFQSE